MKTKQMSAVEDVSGRPPASETTLITGGASGIGLATARHLLSAGWQVVVADSSAESIGQARLQLGSWGSLCEFTQLDIRDEKAVAALIGALEERECALTGLVNCAGIGIDASFLETSIEMFRATLEVNLLGCFVVAQAVARGMASRGRGSIVNIASISALVGNGGRAAYGASKAAIVNLTQVMANELAPSKVRVNCVCPGPIATPLALRVHNSEVRASWHAQVPMKRYGTPAEVASTIRFFLDEALSAYVTGQVLSVDGGFMAAGIQRDWRSEMIS